MRSLDTDVVIVGCGPVGAMTALRCRQRGLGVIVLERDTDIFPLPRALALDDEVQDLFARSGLADDLAANSTPLRGAEFLDAAGTRVVGVEHPPGTVTSLGHPPMVAFDQPAVERFLRRAIIDAGVDLRLDHEVTGLIDGDTVTTQLVDGTELRSRWLIGADGARSTVRDLVGIELIDQQFDQQWLVVDTTLLDAQLALPQVAQQRCSPKRVVTFVPGHDRRRRWEFKLEPHECPDGRLTAGLLDELLAPWGTPRQLRVDRHAVYRFHATVADRFSHGSIFLAGDAAHQMPPFNGQGMCTGMRDAENLSWKLAMVSQGHARADLLATFDRERRPHATSQVAHSVDAGLLIDAIANDGERALESGYGQRPFPKLAPGELVLGDHPFVGRPLPRPADNSFLVGDGWTILRGHDAADATPDEWTNINATILGRTDAAFGPKLTSDQTVVVRPDRLVAAVTGDLRLTTSELWSTLGP